MRRRIAAWSLLAAGTLLLLSSFGLLGHAYLGQWLYQLQAPPVAETALPERVASLAQIAGRTRTPVRAEAATPVPPAAAYPSETGEREAVADLTEADASTEGTDAVQPELDQLPAEELPDYGQPIHMAIPRIGVNARVIGVGLDPRTREYRIDWWHVGWHDDSPQLGLTGNSIFNGHFDTINAGRVFYRLRELTPGDLIYVDSEQYRTTWVVESSERVPNTEWRFIAPTDDLRVTLYTCEGWFDWGTRQYSHFRVVVARPLEAVERG